jgi:hypothetical protein
MNETNGLTCPCGESIIPGPLATEEYINNWLTEHAEHKAPEPVLPSAPAAEIAVEDLCRHEGYAAHAYGGYPNTVIFADEVDALVCARALRRRGYKATASGLILVVEAG